MGDAGEALMEIVRCTRLTQKQALAEWPILSDMLAKADPYAFGRFTVDHLREQLEKGEGIILIMWAPEERRHPRYFRMCCPLIRRYSRK